LGHDAGRPKSTTINQQRLIDKRSASPKVECMSELKVIRFPANAAQVELEPWPDLPAEIIASGHPKQRGKMLFEDKTSGLSAGIWDCTTFIGKQETYPVTEFMLVLEGSVTVFDAHGGSVINRITCGSFSSSSMMRRSRRKAVTHRGSSSSITPTSRRRRRRRPRRTC
jgi:uncharacterized cupin superfamily protein